MSATDIVSRNEMGRELKGRVGALALPDLMSFTGAAAYLLLVWLNWWEWSVAAAGVSQGFSGFHLKTGKIAWLLALVLAAWYVVPQLRRFAHEKVPAGLRDFVPLAIGGAVLALGPVYFFLQSGDAGDPAVDWAGGSSGRTLVYWVALLAAGAAAAGPALKTFGGRGR